MTRNKDLCTEGDQVILTSTQATAAAKLLDSDERRRSHSRR